MTRHLYFSITSLAFFIITISYYSNNNNLNARNKTKYIPFKVKKFGKIDDNNCSKTVNFGNISICLPTIDGMKECYSNPLIKKRADEFSQDGNSIFAIYLPNEIYDQTSELDSIELNDYFKVYAVNRLKDYKVLSTDLDKFQKIVLSNYQNENWKEIKASIEKLSENVSLGKPVLIEDYKPHEKIRTSVILIKSIFRGQESISMMTMNLVEIKNRLIYYSYYLDYVGPETLKQVKAKNDYYSLLLIAENK